MPQSKDESIRLLQDLIKRYKRHRRDCLSSEYNETQLRNDYLNPFLEILGWDIQNDQKLPFFLREVIQEEAIEVSEEDEITKKKPDYTLRIDGKRKYFFEAKKPSVNILSSNKFSFQTRRYGWNANLPISVLANFENLVIYDCRYKPEVEDDVRVARLHQFNFEEYLDRFDEIYSLLSKDSVLVGHFDEVFGVSEVPKGAEPFDEFFLEQIEKWREALAESLIKNNPKLSQSDLNYLVQQTINRIIFLRICEDRDLEKYEDLKHVKDYKSLKKIFLDADKKYDSGLFDFIEDTLSLSVNLDDSALISIFNELYYPQNPYAFSVVDPLVMSEIYELFLSKEIIITKSKKLHVQEKPEVVQSKGAVPTPQFIVDSIAKQTLMPQIKGKLPTEIETFRVADIACGSGIFLLAAYEALMNYHLEWYINNTPSRHKDKIIKLSMGEYRLSLKEKTRILSNNIFGVDIDHQSVEVSKFSLLLKALEDVSIEEVNDYMKRFKEPLLPNLDYNIQWGNSLVDSTYYTFNESLKSEGQLVEINPFDFEDAFPAIFKDGGFDLIIGNPPYLRIQNIVKYSPLEIDYFSSGKSPYVSSRSDNYDKYYLFIERSISLLKPTGLLGYIVPHKFMTIKAGKNLREFLSERSLVSYITHFGVKQIFKDRSATYTCILILDKCQPSSFRIEFVKDLSAWKHGAIETIFESPRDSISAEPWVFIPPQVSQIYERLQKNSPQTLKDVADVFVGLQTSADKIYIIRPDKIMKNNIEFTDIKGNQWKIEKSILRPCLMDVQLDCFSKPTFNAFMIFPYQIDKDGKANLYTQKEMKSNFPECWKYLCSFKDKLKKRSIQNSTPQTWYRFGRSQSLTKFNGDPKLIWPVLSLVPRYAYDDSNVVITGGGNGPYYALRPKKDSDLSIYYILSILSHPVIEAFIRARSSKFRGGYGSHGKQFIVNVPIPKIDFDDKTSCKLYNDINTVSKELISAIENHKSARTPAKRSLYKRQSTTKRNRHLKLIEKLFGLSPEDLKTIYTYETFDDE